MKFNIYIDSEYKQQQQVTVIDYNHKERIERSFKMFSIFFLAFLVAILIPGLHFILCPIFLAMSFYLAYSKYTETSYIDIQKFPCPHCQGQFKQHQIGLKPKFEKIKLFCFHCQKQILLKPTTLE